MLVCHIFCSFRCRYRIHRQIFEDIVLDLNLPWWLRRDIYSGRIDSLYVLLVTVKFVITFNIVVLKLLTQSTAYHLCHRNVNLCLIFLLRLLLKLLFFLLRWCFYLILTELLSLLTTAMTKSRSNIVAISAMVALEWILSDFNRSLSPSLSQTQLG